MAETIIKVNGDSEGAVKALDAAAKSIAGLDASVDSLNEEMTATSRSTASFTAGQAQIQRAAQATQQKMQSAAGALGQLGGALGQVSPAAGAAGSAMNALGGAIGSLPSLLTPATAGMAALTLTVGLGVKAWGQYKESVANAEKATDNLRKVMEAVDNSMKNARVSSAELGSNLLSIVALSPEATRIMQDLQNAETEAGRAAAEDSADNRIRILTEELRETDRLRNENAQSILTRERDLEEARAALARVRAGSIVDRLRDEKLLTDRVAARSAELATAKEEQARLKEEYRSTSAELGTLTRIQWLYTAATTGTSNAVTTLTTDYASMADSMLKAAAASGDFSKINESLGNDGELSRRLTDLLSGFDQGFLLEIGVDTTALTENINRAKTGMDVLSEEAREFAEYNERALEAIKKAGDEEFRRSTAILEQNEWYRMLTMSSAEKAEYDKEQLRIAYELLEANQELTAEQRRRIEEAQAASAKPSGNTSGGAETELSKIDKMNEKLTSFGTSVEGIASGVMGDLTNSIIGAVTEGEKLGEALPQAFLKSIGGMAAQMAAMAAGQALMMTFTPGMQGNAAGLWAASGALTAVAIGAGVAVKAVGKRGKGSSGSTAQESTGGGTNVFVEDSRNSNAYAQSGMRARDYGAAQSNADRLNIDRGRSWA